MTGFAGVDVSYDARFACMQTADDSAMCAVFDFARSLRLHFTVLFYSYPAFNILLVHFSGNSSNETELSQIHDPILLRCIESEAGVSPRSGYGRTPETAVLRRNLRRLRSRPAQPFSFRAHHANVLTVERRSR